MRSLRPHKRAPSPKQIIQRRKQHNAHEHNTGVISERRILDRVTRRPEGEEQDDDQVQDCKGIICHAQDTGDAPGAPDEGLAGDVEGSCVPVEIGEGGGLDVACCPAVEE